AGGELPGIGVNGGTNAIPPMQAFFVHASGDGSVSIDNNARFHDSHSYYKSGKNSETPIVKLAIFGNNGVSDETAIRFYSEATIGQDSEFDAFKLFADDYPQLYTQTTNAVDLAINTLPEVYEGLMVTAGISIPAEGLYSINLLEFFNFDNSIELTIEDLLEGTTYNLSQNPVYNFTASPADDPERFILHFGASSGLTDPEFSAIQIHSFENKIYLNINEGNDPVELSVFNALGQEVLTQKVNAGSSIIDTDLNTGIYTVRVHGAGIYQSKKLLIK
ncbi:MAG TPA: T9SS type A sorting domain-containing protein, partial [Bacteroidales bacterium]|nr:T9SS type A sorting domain-containing protein [Bacteroidales bacterium]